MEAYYFRTTMVLIDINYAYPHVKIAFSSFPWGAMMILAGIGIIFLWVVQIALFEPNYIDASIAAMKENMEPLVTELSELPVDDLSSAAELLRNFSKSTSVRVYLLDEDGEVLISYINGKPIVTYDAEETQKELQYTISGLPAVFRGEFSKEVIRSEKFGMVLNIGVPATYHGSTVAIFVHQSLAAMQTMQELNRNQLVMLSIVMTLVASFIAILLTRNFTKPIKKIETTVMQLAEGDLTAKPDVKRDDELGRLSYSVEELGVALQKVDVLRKEVIANVSHELSAPLSLILGYSEMVRDITGDDPQRRNENMDLIIHETSRLSQMVDDIMDYSKFQSGYGALNIASSNLYELITKEVAVIGHVAAQHDIKVAFSSYSEEILVDVDSLKISQVVRNLLNNAVNHTAKGQTISISVISDMDIVRVNIRNPGKPIPDEELKLIWERYHRVQHQGGRKEGTGIGLSIVSTILEAHGFAYGVESSMSNNTFWFSIK